MKRAKMLNLETLRKAGIIQVHPHLCFEFTVVTSLLSVFPSGQVWYNEDRSFAIPSGGDTGHLSDINS